MLICKRLFIEYKITVPKRKFSQVKFKLHEAHLVEMGNITYSRYCTMYIKGKINEIIGLLSRNRQAIRMQ
jgi:hypothetical protein